MAVLRRQWLRLWGFLRHHGNVVAYALIALAMAGGLKELQDQTAERLQGQADQTAQLLYANSLRACERGNVVREVVYANTRDAMRQNPGAGFERQLVFLQSVPDIDLRDGTVDCREAIPRP